MQIPLTHSRYFDAGEFYFPVSGFTHLDQTQGVTWSAYRCGIYSLNKC